MTRQVARLLFLFLLLIGVPSLHAAPQQQIAPGCYIFDSRLDTETGLDWVLDWGAWPTTDNSRIALGDFVAWEVRVLAYPSAPYVAVYRWTGTESQGVENMPHDGSFLALSGYYDQGIGFRSSYGNFRIEICSPGASTVTPSPSPTKTSTPTNTATSVPTIGTLPLTYTAIPAVDTSSGQMGTVMQEIYDGVTNMAMLTIGGMIIAVFIIYLLFEFLLIILDRRRRGRTL